MLSKYGHGHFHFHARVSARRLPPGFSAKKKITRKFGFDITEVVSKRKSWTQTLRRRSWKWWFWHYNGFNVKAFLRLKRLWCKNSYVLRYSRYKRRWHHIGL